MKHGLAWQTLARVLIILVVVVALLIVAREILPNLESGAQNPANQQVCAISYGNGDWNKAYDYLSKNCPCDKDALEELKAMDPTKYSCCSFYCSLDGNI